MMITLPNRHDRGHHRAIELEGDQRTRGKKSGERKKCGQQVSGSAEGRWRQQIWMETSSLWPMLHWEQMLN